jgi:glyceraldehyde-3-phosphate dehydrogenase (NADP+)
MANMAASAEMLIGGRWISCDEVIEIRNPFDGQLVGGVPRGGLGDVGAAVDAAGESLTGSFPLHERYDVLMRAAARIDERCDEYAWMIASEGSKTIREARREPRRAADILRLSAEEGRRLAGEQLPFDIRKGSEQRVGYFFRFPVGVVGAITPFNDPLAVAAHKIGPAIAGGNAVVLKPSSATPLSPLALGHDLEEAGLPPGRLSIVTGDGEEIGSAIARSPRVRMVSFTGGIRAGHEIAALAGIKKISMELGSNSPVIVMSDADVDQAVRATAVGAFAQAGQNCLAVQRILVHEQIYDVFARKFVDHAAALRVGSSLDETTDVCTMISEREALRLESWVQEAVSQGARVLTGGRRMGALMPPVVLENVPTGVHLDRDEAYGPVVCLYRISSLDEAVALANRTDYGLHAAIFTENLRDAFKAIRRLSVGAVIVNDSTDYRLDIMPFGGTKLSGIGREGVRFSLLEMTETRVVCLNL